MSNVSLHASWIDGEAFQSLWSPLDDADEFILISCYVSQAGWEHLEAILTAHLARPSFRCTLVFSFAGIASSNSRQLVDRLYSLASDARWRGRLVPFVLDDRAARLFHPKAHGSRAGNQFKVVVGSANLTGAGLRTNYELMTLIEGDEGVYNSLQVAVNALAHGSVVRIDEESIGVLRDDLAARDLLERSAPTRTSVERAPVSPARPLPDRKYDLLVHPSSDYLVESSRVRNLMTQGAQLARLDQLDPLSISVPLTTFRDAKVIAATEAKEIGAGLSYETGGSSIAVSLLPIELRKRLKAITRPLGRLIGRFSIEVLGTRWMPIPWEEELRAHWTQIMGEVDFASATEEVLAT